jgi:hypothetical protein
VAQHRNAYQRAKKEKERRVIEAVRKSSEVFPAGELQDFEEPDFAIQTASGSIGIEITAVMPTPYSNCFSSPLAEKRFRENVVEIAEKDYYRRAGAVPVCVGVYFWKIGSGRRDKRVMGRALAEFVDANQWRAKPTETFSWRPNLPEGFSIISISAGSWPLTSARTQVKP